MYSIDINFLNDREAPEQQGGGQSLEIADSQFMVYGGIVAAVAVLIAGGYYLFVSSRLSTLQAESNRLTAQKTEIDNKVKRVGELNTQIAQSQTQAQALTNLFVGQLPTYAVLSDFRRRTPETIQINSYSQTDAPTGSVIQIVGTAKDYQALNDYFLLLQSSPFFDPTQTKLGTATLGSEKNAVVNFSISTALTKQRADKLKNELAEAGAQGLLVRINKLVEQKVIEPSAPPPAETTPASPQ
jgi:type IV pilus assembly protein PilN